MTTRKTIDLIVVVLVVLTITLSLTIPAPALYPLAAVFGLLEAGMKISNMLDD
jgi:hypothetical protein